MQVRAEAFLLLTEGNWSYPLGNRGESPMSISGVMRLKEV
jgi:hypothetical protein